MSGIKIDGTREHQAECKEFADELRKYWTFDDRQQHTHSWHDRENFIEKVLPKLIGPH